MNDLTAEEVQEVFEKNASESNDYIKGVPVLDSVDAYGFALDLLRIHEAKQWHGPEEKPEPNTHVLVNAKGDYFIAYFDPNSGSWLELWGCFDLRVSRWRYISDISEDDRIVKEMKRKRGE